MPALLIALLILATSPAVADTIAGPARVIDGDTLEINGETVRLHGIDAPELKQTCRTARGAEQRCGELARQALAALVENQSVTCKGDTRDRYGRLIAVCRVGWLDIGEKMVLDGWALAFRKYSQDYVRAETFAKARREGMVVSGRPEFFTHIMVCKCRRLFWTADCPLCNDRS